MILTDHSLNEELKIRLLFHLSVYMSDAYLTNQFSSLSGLLDVRTVHYSSIVQVSFGVFLVGNL